MNEEVVDMPSWITGPLRCHTEVSLHPGKSGSALGRSDIHAPPFGEAEGAKRTNLHPAAVVAEDQAVGTSIHIPTAGAAGQLRYGACRHAEPGPRARDKDLPPQGMRDARLTGQERSGRLRGNRTARTLRP